MGYKRHHAILVTSYNNTFLNKAHEKAKVLFHMDMVSNLYKSPVNHYSNFAIFPDGSKEGWEESNVFDKAREEFIKWLDKQRYEDNSTCLDWVCIQYGDGNHETNIIADSDELIRKEGYK